MKNKITTYILGISLNMFSIEYYNFIEPVNTIIWRNDKHINRSHKENWKQKWM